MGKFGHIQCLRPIKISVIIIIIINTSVCLDLVSVIV